MFFHNFKYSLKTIFANKMLIFWTFIFPIVLGTLFSLAFSNIEDNEKLKIINIAVVNNDELNENIMFKSSIDKLSQKDSNRLFKTRYVSLDAAKELLENGDITGYIELINNKANITVNNNGINETVIRYAVDEINSNIDIINHLTLEEVEQNIKDKNLETDIDEIYQKIIQKVNNNTVKINNISNKNLSYTMIEYYTLIAMSCLYGGILAMFIVNLRLANMCGAGKRTSISCISKTKIILSSLLASYVVQLIGVLILFLYTIFVLNVDYGDNLLLIIVLTLVGSLAGLSLGVFISCVIKTHENAKVGIHIAIVMVFSYLSGMMGITMKYIIDTNVPILSMINPASMITDGLYSLYYYNTYSRYYFDIVCLLLFSLVMILISLSSLRRQKYDSI